MPKILVGICECGHQDSTHAHLDAHCLSDGCPCLKFRWKKWKKLERALGATGGAFKRASARNAEIHDQAWMNGDR